ncbi:hypothetical protein N7539_000286 [Penicillium diatomitis]|uniref:Uncharacterized protein n=1 Tax=Penicillium diatomitis TaxID=2819901 RepID=A0A9W9XMD5_9EURO|nr:uncharacterized protein N7539_000286 [Penicillium diatomitis]KAJ5495170.1 hypothetical protein N7539_000286 [Penicillium diatomitis]
MKTAVTRLPDGHGHVYKEVRFSPTATPPLRRVQSVSTSTPSMISKFRPVRMSPLSQEADASLDLSYIDQSRELVEAQRAHWDSERALFALERQLWVKERTLLRAKISELESMVQCQRSTSNYLNTHTFKPSFASPQYSDSHDSLPSAQVWEGSSPGHRPTRVFLDEGMAVKPHMSPVSIGHNSEPPSLDAALSPRARAVDAQLPNISIPVPIEKVDSKLDGITLKSTALPPNVVARVITPPSPSPLEAPSPAPATEPARPVRPGMEHRNSLKLRLSDLGPPNENRVRDAGHTPMAVIEVDVSLGTTENASPTELSAIEPQGVDEEEEEAPLAPAATQVHQPSEHAGSYFPDVPDDPALQGPLGLINDKEHDSKFLSELDSRLLSQAKRILSTTTIDEDLEEPDDEESPNGEPEPEIKFKKSTNFGTAFGLSSLGKV